MTEKNNTKKIDLKQKVGKIISQRRKLLGFTQSQLAEKIGMEQESLSRIEKGITGLKFSRLESLSEALDCSVADFFRNVDTNNNQSFNYIFDQIEKLSAKEKMFFIQIMENVLDAFVKNRA